MNIDVNEALRYLGYYKVKGDETTLCLIDECSREIQKKSECRYTIRRFPLEVTEDEIIKIDSLSFKSHSLYRNLKDCDEVLLFAATLGPEIDRILQRYSKINMAKAVVFQATAAAAIEAYCDEVQALTELQMAEEKLFVRPRFSPGYGDVDLAIQKDFLKLIGASATVGITLSEGNLMIPEKSVTAFMGLSKIKTNCIREGCEICGKKDCLYRRDKI